MRTVLDQIFLGRSGMDQLNKTLLAGAVLCYLVSMLTASMLPYTLLHYACLLMAALCVVRAMSRNLERRYAENQRFLSSFGRIRGFGECWQMRLDQRRQYKIFKCPSCGVKLRVPRGKGRVRIHCRQCGASFEKKS